MADDSLLNLNNLDIDGVQQYELVIVDAIKQVYPSMDVSLGTVWRSLIIQPAAMMLYAQKVSIDTIREALYMSAAMQNADTLDNATAESLASNYRVERREGEPTYGTVTIVIRNKVTTMIPGDTQFTAYGITFIPLQAYVGVPSEESVTSDQHRLITDRADGTYSFTVPVKSVESGAYFIKKDTVFTIKPTNSAIVQVVATEDFDEGRETESNSAMLQRAWQGITDKVLSNRAQITAAIQEQVPSTQHVSVIGFGDPEMLRDQDNLFEFSSGGRVDIYVATRSYPVVRTVTKDATLINAAQRLWEVYIQPADFPGFYGVKSVNLPATPETPISSGTLSVVVSESSKASSIAESGFSFLRGGVYQFIDNNRSYSGLIDGSTDTYEINLIGMPDIDTLQTYVDDDDVRNPKADYLVKAAVPVIVTISITIKHDSALKEPDIDDIKAEIVQAVNSLGYDAHGVLNESVIVSAVQKHLESPDYVCTPIGLQGVLYKPDGDSVVLNGPNCIEVPDEPENGVTANTALFFVSLDDITIDTQII